MAKAEATILNYLNEDCWKAVLDKVPVKDIIRTEATSHGWQKVILTYLRRSRIGIGHYDLYCIRSNAVFLNIKDNTAEFSSFKSCINKLGSSVVSSESTKDYSLEIIGENCPNLERLMLVQQENQTLLKVQYENFRWLKRLYFLDCDSVSDAAISRFVCNNTVLEELRIISNDTVTGKFLADIKSTLLKSLGFYKCKELEANHLLSSVQHSLTTFQLGMVPKDLYKMIHLILQKLPKLEHLAIIDFDHYYGDKCDLQRDLFTSVCRLSSLKSIRVSLGVTDQYLEDVTRCCKDLTSLEFGDCTTVTSRGVAAVLRNAGARLKLLGLPSNKNGHLTDDDAIACIKGCPNLKMEYEGEELKFVF